MSGEGVGLGDRQRRGRAVDLPGADPHALARALSSEGDEGGEGGEGDEGSEGGHGGHGGECDRTVASAHGPVRVVDADRIRVTDAGERPGGDAGGDRDGDAAGGGDAAAIRIETPPPGPLGERVNPLVPGRSVPVRAALSAAARTLGASAPQDRAIRETREALEAIDPEPVDARSARRRVAEAGDRETELAERVAELRGRVQAREDAGLDAEEARAELDAATTDLAEARTERIAAEQALERARERAREQRDRRERRLELADRLGNLRRAARAHLAGEVWDEFRAALAAVPGEGSAGGEPGSYRGDPLTAALAAVRVGDPDAPVVIGCGRFPDAASAAEVLGTPVIRVPG